MKRIFLPAIALFGVVASSLPSRGMTIEGVTLPKEVSVAGATLPLNGAGLRVFRLGPVPIKVYVAALYAPSPVRSSEEVLASSGPLQFDFIFLRGFSQAQVTEAWNAQFKESVSYDYAGLADDQRAFVASFGALRKGTRQTVTFVGSETQVFEDGVLQGTVRGRDFQRAFLSLWFGAKPVAAELKEALLGKN